MNNIEFLENAFFAYFFSASEYIPVLFAFAIVLLVLAGFYNFILGVDRDI